MEFGSLVTFFLALHLSARGILLNWNFTREEQSKGRIRRNPIILTGSFSSFLSLCFVISRLFFYLFVFYMKPMAKAKQHELFWRCRAKIWQGAIRTWFLWRVCKWNLQVGLASFMATYTKPSSPSGATLPLAAPHMGSFCIFSRNHAGCGEGLTEVIFS